jgi:hypothetical protein
MRLPQAFPDGLPHRQSLQDIGMEAAKLSEPRLEHTQANRDQVIRPLLGV